MVDDVCPYIIVSDSDLLFNTQIRIDVNAIDNADVVLITGTSLDVVSE